ncbi:hypothetical protein [uncultured Cohaesibacter sp.]|uniref:hypothetical protein n=1 Tax=uncultured Cohaesibacter sp. TaxID=1002546 RepID=UPI0029C8F888|nr:hypothetical protein [uncultured Cohaesibacter sp.]
MNYDRVNAVHVSVFRPGYSPTPLVRVVAPNQSHNYHDRGLTLGEAIELHDKLQKAIEDIRARAEQ